VLGVVQSVLTNPNPELKSQNFFSPFPNGKLIASATADNLKWLIKRLDAFVDNKSEKKSDTPKRRKTSKSNEKNKTPRQGSEVEDKTQSSQIPSENKLCVQVSIHQSGDITRIV
jgi:hypothetical protein